MARNSLTPNDEPTTAPDPPFPPRLSAARRNRAVWLALLATGIGSLFLPTPRIHAQQGAAWGPPAIGPSQPSQPGLAEALEEAPPLVLETLMDGPDAAWDQHRFWVPNRDGQTWDVLFLYSPRYMGPHELFILDTGSGELRRQTIDRGFMFHMIDHYLIGGKMVFKPHVEGRDGEAVWIYDPDENAMRFGGRPMGEDLENFGGKWVLEDGILYGFGRIRQPDEKAGRYAAYRLDPESLEAEVFPPFAEVHDGHDWIYTSLHKDGDWLYAKVGNSPWRLWGYNVATREHKLIVETQPITGDHRTIRVIPLVDPGGFELEVSAPKESSREMIPYWLRNGEIVEKTGDIPPWSETKLAHLRTKESSFPKPEMRRTPPDADGKVTLEWRPPGQPDAPWEAVDFTVILHPQPIRRMVALPDGRLFALGESYARATLLDPDTNSRTTLGRTMSVYSMTEHEGTVYMTGYAGARVWKYDPTNPWTVGLDAVPIGQGADQEEPGAPTSPGSNPLEVARLQEQTRMQMTCGGTTVGADGKVYASGWIIRVGRGGALGWWDPETGASGGLTDPFSAFPIYWMAGIGDGTTANRYLALSTKTCPDDNNPAYTPPQGKVFIFDTLTHQIVHETVPTTAGFHGPVVEATPGVIMGFARESGDDDSQGLLWAVEVSSGRTLWQRHVPAVPVTAFAFVRRNAGTILQRGPDQKIWTFFDKTLVHLDPEDGEVTVVGKLEGAEPGQLTFVGSHVYLAGNDQLYRVHPPAE
ncbi:hypothetical protein BH23VER1_BH23VER1_26780 [soil metagenome]